MEEQPVVKFAYDNTMFKDSFPTLDCSCPNQDLDKISQCLVESDEIESNNKVNELSDSSDKRKHNYKLCLPQTVVQRQRSSSSSSSSSSSESEMTPSPFHQMQSFSDNKPITLNVSNLQTSAEGCVGIQTAPVYYYNQVVQNINLPDDEQRATEALKTLTSDAVKIQKRTCRQLTAANPSSPNSSLPNTKPSGDGEGVKPQLWRRSCYHTGLITVTCVILMAIATFILHFTVSSHSHSEPSSSPQPHTSPPHILSTPAAPTVHSYSSPGKLEGADMLGGPLMVDRGTWLAQPPTSNCERHNLTLPVKTVVVCYTATDSCFTEPQCIRKIRSFQEFHIESRHWCDIAYNFLIGGDGAVYEGRGWNEVGSHTKGYNFGTLGVAFIGTFIENLPNADQLKAFRGLLEVGVKLGKISLDYSLYAQCQLRATSAPGWALAMEMYNNWPHFNKSLAIKCDRPDPA